MEGGKRPVVCFLTALRKLAIRLLFYGERFPGKKKPLDAEMSGGCSLRAFGKRLCVFGSSGGGKKLSIHVRIREGRKKFVVSFKKFFSRSPFHPDTNSTK